MKKLSLVFAAGLVIVCSFYMVFRAQLVNGILAGYLTGVINFFIITLTVKNLLGADGASSASKALKAVFIYLAKLAAFGGLIAFLVIYRETYSIKGFLAGFTATLIIIGIFGMITKRTANKK